MNQDGGNRNRNHRNKNQNVILVVNGVLENKDLMVDVNLTEQDKIILDHILLNTKGIDEDTLYFELSLYHNIRWWMYINSSLVALKMNRLIKAERVYLRTGESMVVYKGIK